MSGNSVVERRRGSDSGRLIRDVLGCDTRGGECSLRGGGITLHGSDSAVVCDDDRGFWVSRRIYTIYMAIVADP